MQTGIHPTVYDDAVVICSCGAKHTIACTVKEQHVEVCSECHPFYTGKMKIVDTAGRVDKFKARMAAKDRISGDVESSVKKKTEKKAEKTKKEEVEVKEAA